MANCYFISCHRDRDHVSDLFRFLYRPGHLYILHHDEKAPPLLRDLISRLAVAFPNVMALPAHLHSWGGYSLVATALRAMEAALKSGHSWEHFFWLSEQHLPLFSQDSPGWGLEVGTSYCDAIAVEPMYAEGRADVLHRFSMDFRELPGVGCFGEQPATMDGGFMACLWHGGNWLVLARAACEILCAQAADPVIAAPFVASALPDETFLQSLLMTAAGRGEARVLGQSPTYVAWPHLCGNADMLCTPENVHVAREQGRLFIRKRPLELPLKMRGEMEAMAVLDAAALEARLSTVEVPEPEIPIRDVQPLVQHVAAGMAGLEGYTVRVFDPAVLGNVPAFYMTITPDHAPEDLRGLRLCLLSEDLRNFKVLIAIHPPEGAGWAPVTVRGRHAYPLRVRVYDLFLEREVVIADETDGGFVTLAANGDLTPLDQTIHRYLGHMEALVAAAGQA
ncbi:beta-1,6-N-acetylglucosaminyltransferase [Nitrospirillum iridis]|uniref:Peptide O-xylosyltransferase n=1 Tax=Nitrospirillum iridis TaxID=765888 RepID=A0A7X0B4X3_9PROT|nr:beta-1,6-N-acetylglucosaminyltransferase [Nitrospirillum iridis]MBB6255041.1 hypothetical protein [Nitrospirillum iridis]